MISKTRIQAEEILEDIKNYLKNKYNQSDKVFTPSSAFGQILYAISYITEMILFFIEDSITELNIFTASKKSSIYGLSRLTGHNPTRSVSATGEITFSLHDISNVKGDSILIPKYSKIKCINNNRIYILNLEEDYLLINIKDKKTYYSKIIQGELQSQTFTGTGEKLQSYNVAARGSQQFENNFVNVYVNGELWSKKDSLYDLSMNEKGYIIKTGINSGIDIYFGNMYFGMIPPLGSSIRVEYLLSSGTNGNLLLNNDVYFEWIDNGYDNLGNDINLNDTLYTALHKQINFGADYESPEFTKLIAPEMSRSFVLATTENYKYFFKKFNYFSSIDAFTTFEDNYIDDDNVIYLFLIPDISKRLTSNENYFTVNTEYFKLTNEENDKIIDLIEESGSKMINTIVKLVDPVIKKYVINIYLVIYEKYSVDTIYDDIIMRLSDYFLSLQRRDLIPASDLVKIIEDVDGVDSVNLYFISEENEQKHMEDPNDKNLYGLDVLGNIVMKKNELPVIRGGWSDRLGNVYLDCLDKVNPSSVNIYVTKKTKKY
ncbi:MAG TPA: hypothetical protein PKY44_00635 [Bacteroidales bacterium]|nr:hypothetical protein [Bacteroidales bacterium]